MAPALTSSPPSFRPVSSPLRRRAATVLCRVAKPGKDSGADDDGPKKRPGLFADFGKLTDAKSLVPALSSPATGSLFAGGGRGRKDPQTVFVAGATGQAGVRIAQTLLRQGFAVRAGVPDLASAQELARLAAAYRLISPAEARRLNAVESGFDDPEAIAKSIGPAAKVVVTVGPAEKGPEGGAVTTDDALRLVQAADLAGVAHVVVVYDEGSSSGFGGAGSTYNVLDGFTSFFSNLFSRVQTLTLSQFLAKVVETDVRYTLVKASLTDDYSPESSYALVLAKEGASPSTTSSTDTGKVSKLQIAALVADVFSNVGVAENKVVEVSTNSSATSKLIAEAFVSIPEDSRRKEYQEAAAKAQAEEEARASQRASEAEAAASKLEAKGKEEAPSEEAAAIPVNGAQASLENLLSRAKGISRDFSWEKFSTQLAEATTPRTSTEKEPKAQIATVRGQAKAKKLTPQRAVVKPAAQKEKPQLKQPDPKPEVRPVFGGLFKQETVYVDDD
ncbi:Protein plastid transcriptionally active 16, chloroplastic [Dichanthelium oligosanthes]|uniref:Protein plastid transcriptionally active 16, chloroplastic n=1 Tax=Dichanthelium oligosanthes TaxID=888268 RepID=A0A1E5UVN5_9POAL|nr:Protein plastid transcriptionally active 16, chloroplastic [Dichanthelium oligosanthes]